MTSLTLRQQVAEELMGWSVTVSYPADVLGDSELVTGIRRDAEPRLTVPAFDADWNAAMSVVAKVSRQPFLVRQAFVANLQREVSKKIFKPGVDVYAADPGSLVHGSWLWFHAEPKHICNAALKAFRDATHGCYTS